MKAEKMNTNTPCSKAPSQGAGDGEGEGGLTRRPAGMCVERGGFSAAFNSNGDLSFIRAGGIQVSQYEPGIHDRPLAGLWLRRHRGGRVDSLPLTGSGSGASFSSQAGSPIWAGVGMGVSWRVQLVPAAMTPSLPPSGEDGPGAVRSASWVWQVDVRPVQGGPLLPSDRWDLVSAQDLALVEPSMARGAESYTSQYIAYHAEEVPGCGRVLSARQTMGCAPRLPLFVTGIAEGCRTFMTDGYDFYGLGARLGYPPAALGDADWAGGGIDQYEFAMACLLSQVVAMGETGLNWHVWNTVSSDYRGGLDKACLICARAFDKTVLPTVRPTDDKRTGDAKAQDSSVQAGRGGWRGTPSLLASARPLNGEPLPEDEFSALGGGPVLQAERDQAGNLLSYFGADARHVVSSRKELEVARTHGQILLSGNPTLDPDRPTMAVTTYAGGIFASQVVLGNTNMNQLVSVQKTGLGLLRSRGVRILVNMDGEWRLLGVPSAYIMDLGGSRWIYRLGDRTLTVSTVAHLDRPVIGIRLEASDPVPAMVTVDLEDPAIWRMHSLPADGTHRVGGAVSFMPDGGSPAADRCPGLRYVISSPDALPGDDCPLFEDGGEEHPDDPGMVTFLSDGGQTLSLTLTGSMDGVAGAGAGDGVDDRSDKDLLHSHYEAMKAFMLGLHVVGEGRFAEFNLLLPWFVQNALVHFLSPHGLEQYGGAAWGTRDVCQGPLELALTFGHDDLARTILLKVFAHQNPDGSLPQWFMFDQYADVYQHDSHGDIPVWPLLSLAEYMEAGGDLGLLDANVDFWQEGVAVQGGADGRTGPSADASVGQSTDATSGTGAGNTHDAPTVADHLARTLDYIQSHRVPGTDLFCYGEGDWDDTLQPAQESMKRQMASTWTIALLYQACRSLQPLLESAGRTDLASRFADEADRIGADFAHDFIFQGVLAGYVNFVDGQPRPVIHPTDTRTGIRYRLIPMTRSIIAGLLTPEQEEAHERIIEGNLHYPDGVRLMDRPASFHDGVTRVFKRAEQAANVGREIGLMYTHAHVRYTEALGLLGRTRLGQELLRISPVGQFRRLPTSEPRQRNCYFASSDADFPDRYTAAAQWSRLKEGAEDPVGVRGGWRIYSSGPGIYCRQVVQHLFGVQLHAGCVVFDPVLSLEDDGLEVTMALFDRLRTIRYHVCAKATAFASGPGPADGTSRDRGICDLWIEADGRRLDGDRRILPYRKGGIEVTRDQLADADRIDIFLMVDGQTVK